MYEKIEGGRVINIQGLECSIPPEGYVFNVINKELEYVGIHKRSDIPEQQYWERPKLPDWFSDVMKAWDAYDKKKKEDDPDFYDERLERFKRQEWGRRMNGFWFMNYNPEKKQSEAMYITGMYYMLLMWWQIDIGFSSFTIPHLNKFYFLQYCIEDPFCFGMIDITKRRFLKTFIGGLFVTEKISRTKNANGSMQSKSGKDAKKLFSKAVVDPFRRLVKFFRPEYDMSLGVNPKTEMRFQRTNVRGKKAEDAAFKDELNSVIDWETADEIALDGQKLIAYFCDEWGKTKEANVFDRHEVVRFCLVDHEGRVIGKALYSTTVEQVDNESNDIDKSAKQLWDASDQNNRQENGQTSSGLYRFFQTADEAKNFDIYGYPDIEKNIKTILSDRKAARNNPRQLSARIRKEPRTVDEAFLVSSEKCIFNSVNILNRKRDLLDSPIYKRAIWFERDIDGRVRWRDITENESEFHWKISEWGFPAKGEENKYTRISRLKRPGRTRIGRISIDGYSNSQGGKFGSKACASMGLTFDINNPDNTGKPVGILHGRPSVKDTLHEQVLLAAEYMGFKAWYEHNADDYESYARQRGLSHYLGIYPLSVIEPTKRADADRYKGFPTTPFSLTKQNDMGIAYFESYCHKIDFMEYLEDAETYDPNDRNKSDITVSLLMLIVLLYEPEAAEAPLKQPLVREYANPSSTVA